MLKFFPERKSYGVLAVPVAGSAHGTARTWLKENGERISFATMEEAEAYAELENKLAPNPNAFYIGMEIKKGAYHERL